MNQDAVRASLPLHLQPFVATQNYESYSARDHAIWRFLIRQLRLNLADSAHAVYLEGLERTGLSDDAIPRIENINEKMQSLGWRAVVVDGFVPPAVFMEFQAHRVMPIAVDMRTLSHMLYTPAPDIVHESAGHLPFVVDVDYAEFLQRFGELGMHAVASAGDLAVYEAVRHLSVVKEDPSATDANVAAAEKQLKNAVSQNHPPSEAALLARLHWWTVEYGLVGSLDDYRIFGAGLLSSLGESVNCLDDDKVKKRPLTVDAINSAYDITAEQPQLFVTESCRHLSQVLEEFAKSMCVNQGGSYGIQTAIAAATVNTAVSNAGIQISGRFTEGLSDAVGNLTYLRTEGNTQLAYQGAELSGHGIDYHSEGFGSPIGRLQTMERCLSTYTVDELKRHGITVGAKVTLDFLSGISVQGELISILRRDQKNLLMSFRDCRVKHHNGRVLFEPDWGQYDMAIGASVISVFGGSADQNSFSLHTKPSDVRRQLSATETDAAEILDAYSDIRSKRTGKLDKEQASDLINKYKSHPEWLVKFELLEIASELALDEASAELVAALKTDAANGSADQRTLIQHGLRRLA